MQKKYIVDRIESHKVVLEDENGEIIVIDVNKVEQLPSEGDILINDNNIFKIDIEATNKRREYIREKMKGMWEN